MKKPHVLFVTEKWCDCNPERGLTNSFHNLFGSLKSTGLATYSNLFFDEYTISKKTKIDDDFITFGNQADIVVIAPLNGIHHAPQIKSYRFISKPIVAIHFDSVSPKNLAYADAVVPYVKFNVVLDSGFSYKSSPYDDRYLALWTPQDPTIFRNPGVNRDIPVSFLGTMKHRQDREDGINYLGSKDVKVYQMGGQREKYISIEEYADVLQRSLVTLNFSMNHKWHQLKGRIFEAMLCGACLVESQNDEIKEYFTDGEDYISFKNTEGLLYTVRSLLDDRKFTEKIARSGQAKCEKLYNAENWWKRVFDRAGVKYE